MEKGWFLTTWEKEVMIYFKLNGTQTALNQSSYSYKLFMIKILPQPVHDSYLVWSYD